MSRILCKMQAHVYPVALSQESAQPSLGALISGNLGRTVKDGHTYSSYVRD